VIAKKNTNFIFGYLVRILRGVDFWYLRRSFTSGKIISKLDIKYKCEISQFFGKCFVHTKHLTVKFICILEQNLSDRYFFLEVKFQNFRFKYSMKEIFVVKSNLVNQKLFNLSLDYFEKFRIIVKSGLICFYFKN
jgi:hypothetical protein